MRYVLGIDRNQTKYGAYSAKIVQKNITKGGLLPFTKSKANACFPASWGLGTLRPKRAVFQSKTMPGLIKRKCILFIKKCGRNLNRKINTEQ